MSPGIEILGKAYSLGVLIIGISHMTRPRLWAGYFGELRKSPYGAFTIGMLTLPLGLLFVIGHNVWVVGIPVFITLAGWAMTIKSVVYLLFPGTFQRVSPDNETTFARGYVAVGAMMTAAGLVLSYHAFLRS